MKIDFDLSQTPKDPRLWETFDVNARMHIGHLQRHDVDLHYKVRTQVDTYHTCNYCLFHCFCDIKTRVWQRLNGMANDELPECQAQYRKDGTDVIFIPVLIDSKKIEQ